ncbi:MAG: nucleoside-diphosphate kinase [Bacillota bacterium]
MLRKLVGKIIRRIEEVDLSIEELKMKQYSSRIMSELYRKHESKDFFSSLIKHMASVPIIALKLSGPEGTIKKMRKIIGSTNPLEADAGTIRGDLSCTMVPDNLVHASDSKENSERELALFF